jgi:hypothetical protein
MSITFQRSKMFERILKRICSKFNSALVGSVTRASRLSVFSEGFFFFFLGTPTMGMVDYPHKHNLQNQWTRHRYRKPHCKSISTMDITLNITWSGCKSNLLDPWIDQLFNMIQIIQKKILIFNKKIIKFLKKRNGLKWWQNQNRKKLRLRKFNRCLPDTFWNSFSTVYKVTVCYFKWLL